MKAFLAFILILGVAQAMLPSGKISGLFRSSLSNLNISDFSAVQKLFNKNSNGRELVLQAAAASFTARFRNSDFLSGKSKSEIMKNFIENARNILSQPIDSSWQPGLDIEILGLSQSEFQSLLTARPPTRSGQSNQEGSISSSHGSRRKRQSDLPKSVDWRNKNAVTPVKNQGKCGSCWAFAAVGALEGRIAVKTGNLPVLSEQNLVDCAKNIGEKDCCQGCGGGWIADGYTYVKENGGILSNASYPYEAKDGQCRYDAANKAGNAVGYEYTEQDDEDDLMRAVAEGPVAVAVDATQWSAYKTGVFRCKTLLTMLRSTKINHGVVVVGYDTSRLWGDYWIVKNSWGPSWGEKGYIKIARNAGNQCGIAGTASYPLV